MNKIIQTFTKGYSPPQEAKDAKTNAVVARTHRQTFLEPVPETNSCKDVGIPEPYCACYPVESVPTSDLKLEESAEKAVQKINFDLNTLATTSGASNMCAKLMVGKITAGAKMDKGDIIRYVVGFVTLPGEFLIEAEIDFLVANKTFHGVPNVQRASKIDQNHVKCINNPKIELFCYCKDVT